MVRHLLLPRKATVTFGTLVRQLLLVIRVEDQVQPVGLLGPKFLHADVAFKKLPVLIVGEHVPGEGVAMIEAPSANRALQFGALTVRLQMGFEPRF